MERGWEGHGYVKAVPSGDRIVIMAKTKSRSGPPPEITLILDSIAAPKLAIRDGVSEPFAWYSREFLRNYLIGKPVKFRVDRKIEGSTRHFGTAFDSEGRDVTEVLVSEGWAKVKESPSYLRGDDTARSRLLRLEIAAKSSNLGMWSKIRSSSMPERRKISIVPDARKLFREVQNKDLDAIIEYVRDGSSYRVVLVDYMFSIVFNLVGVTCPRLGRKSKEGDVLSDPEPYVSVMFEREARELFIISHFHVSITSEEYYSYRTVSLSLSLSNILVLTLHTHTHTQTPSSDTH